MRHSPALPALLLLVALRAHGAANVDAARLTAAASDPANWLTTGRTYSEERFSPLAQINDRTVVKLGLALPFTRISSIAQSPLVTERSHETH